VNEEWMTPAALEVKRMAGIATVRACRRYRRLNYQRNHSAMRRKKITAEKQNN